jgi:hypothetical protein
MPPTPHALTEFTHKPVSHPRLPAIFIAAGGLGVVVGYGALWLYSSDLPGRGALLAYAGICSLIAVGALACAGHGMLQSLRRREHDQVMHTPWPS